MPSYEQRSHEDTKWVHEYYNWMIAEALKSDYDRFYREYLSYKNDPAWGQKITNYHFNDFITDNPQDWAANIAMRIMCDKLYLKYHDYHSEKPSAFSKWKDEDKGWGVDFVWLNGRCQAENDIQASERPKAVEDVTAAMGKLNVFKRKWEAYIAIENGEQAKAQKLETLLKYGSDNDLIHAIKEQRIIYITAVDAIRQIAANIESIPESTEKSKEILDKKGIPLVENVTFGKIKKLEEYKWFKPLKKWVDEHPDTVGANSWWHWEDIMCIAITELVQLENAFWSRAIIYHAAAPEVFKLPFDNGKNLFSSTAMNLLSNPLNSYSTSTTKTK